MPVILDKDIHKAWFAGDVDNKYLMEHSLEKLIFDSVK
jgi:hypothetical protein